MNDYTPLKPSYLQAVARDFNMETIPEDCSAQVEAFARFIERAAIENYLAQQKPVAPNDEVIAEDWITASDVDGIAYDGPSFEAGYHLGEIAERDRNAPTPPAPQDAHAGKDAERYRAVRHAAVTNDALFMDALDAGLQALSPDAVIHPSFEQFDAMIDAAIAAAKGKE